MKKIGMLAFCLTSSWTVATWADAAPEGCTVATKNVEYDMSCAQCSPDGGVPLADCQRTRQSAGKSLVCTNADNGVEVWCSPAAGSRAKPSGCSLTTTGGPSPLGVLAALGGLGLAIVLGRRWRRG
jgi:hypothetical protein